MYLRHWLLSTCAYWSDSGATCTWGFKVQRCLRVFARVLRSRPCILWMQMYVRYCYAYACCLTRVFACVATKLCEKKMNLSSASDAVLYCMYDCLLQTLCPQRPFGELLHVHVLVRKEPASICDERATQEN